MDMTIPPKPCSDVPLNCSVCGSWLTTWSRSGTGIASSAYNGTDVCDACVDDHCGTTNCLDCGWGEYPNCQFAERKRNALNEEYKEKNHE